MFTGDEQNQIRLAAFDWLKDQELLKPWFTRSELRTQFTWRGQVIPLVDSRKGIWNPKDFSETLSTLSTLDGPYEDSWTANGDLDYAYQGEAGTAGTNTKLRLAYLNQTPLIHFEEFEPSKYIARYPVFVTDDALDRRYFTINLDGAPSKEASALPVEEIAKEYRTREIRQRVHQKPFRAVVLRAYKTQCAICRLQHVDLLDAAHIRPDSDARSSTSVTNGLSLCKIHHAAYDRDILSISADYRVHVNEQVLREVDGPMLKHGIQAMNGISISMPDKVTERPDRELLDERFRKFVAQNS